MSGIGGVEVGDRRGRCPRLGTVGVLNCLHLGGRRVYTPNWFGRQKADMFDWKVEELNIARGAQTPDASSMQRIVLYRSDFVTHHPIRTIPLSLLPNLCSHDLVGASSSSLTRSL